MIIRDLAGWVNESALGLWRFPKVLPLRSTPVDNLTAEVIRKMIKKLDFYSTDKYDWAKEWSNPNGKGIDNDFVLQQSEQVVLDRATGLMWQQAGSSNPMTFADAQKHIDNLNNNRFAGYSDWRFPECG